MGIIRTRLKNLPVDLRAEILRSLNDSGRFRSTEMDILPWIILAFVSAAAGLAGALYSVSWDMAGNSIRHGEGWDSIAVNNPELPGMAASVLILIWCIFYWIAIHGRCGQMIIPGAVLKIRGGKIIMFNVADAVESSTSRFEYGSEERGRRTGSALAVKLADGSTFKILSGNGPWISRIREHIDSGGKI